jgi:hypothetical protein
VKNHLSSLERDDVERHLDVCPECISVVAEFVREERMRSQKGSLDLDHPANLCFD